MPARLELQLGSDLRIIASRPGGRRFPLSALRRHTQAACVGSLKFVAGSLQILFASGQVQAASSTAVKSSFM